MVQCIKQLLEVRDLKITICEEHSGKTVGELLKNHLKFPSSTITFLKSRDNGIILNGERVTVRKTLKTGDLLELEYTDEKTVAELSSIEPVKLPLDIIYEDGDVIALNKPPHMPTHPSHNHRDDTLANGLRYYFDSLDIPFIFRAVNRLDNNTSGVVLVAKNRIASAKLSVAMTKKEISKSYLAIIHGCPEPSDGQICLPIKREQESIIKRIVSEGGAYSLTNYRTIYSNGMYSLVEASPITGRTHQLRVHFSHTGHPICGDTLYGYPSEFIARQALHAYKLSFTQPMNGKELTLFAKPPKDIVKLFETVFDGSADELERLLEI